MPHPLLNTTTPTLVDVSLLREPPATARGARTRTALIQAARTVFERDGYVDSRLVDITAEAGCSTGTFYIYFAGKEEVFHALLESVQDDMLHPGFGLHVDADAAPYDLIVASNRAYLEAYQRNAGLMRILDQVATTDARLREARIHRAAVFVERNARGIAKLQQRGLADRSLDPHQTARALSAMVSRTAFHVFCLDDEPQQLDDLVDLLSRLWANAIRLAIPGAAS